MKTLLLIDANALIHRFFHALPPLTAPDKRPVGALYGLAGILLKVFRDGFGGNGVPEYIAAAFDRPEPTFRKQEFEAYKIHRPPAANELVAQIIEAHRLLGLFGVPIYELPGFEADDVLGTLAEMFKGEIGRVVILSGDLDVLQLVDGDRVVAEIIKTGVSETARYDRAAVIARYGLPPEKLPDYKGLVGDASDNIPGVKGIGPKTAAELLTKYGSLEKIFEEAALIPGALGKKLENQAEIARQSKRLATIRRDAPFAVTLESLKMKPFDTAALTKYFDELGFRTLVARLHRAS